MTAAAARILVVDDNTLNVRLVEFVLTQSGFSVESADDPHAALEKVATFRPDAILMDIRMPEVDGLTLARRLKSDPQTRGIRVIAFTAYAMVGDEEKFLAAGCDGYIAKPIDVASFSAQVEAVLDKV